MLLFRSRSLVMTRTVETAHIVSSNFHVSGDVGRTSQLCRGRKWDVLPFIENKLKANLPKLSPQQFY